MHRGIAPTSGAPRSSRCSRVRHRGHSACGTLRRNRGATPCPCPCHPRQTSSGRASSHPQTTVVVASSIGGSAYNSFLFVQFVKRFSLTPTAPDCKAILPDLDSIHLSQSLDPSFDCAFRCARIVLCELGADSVLCFKGFHKCHLNSINTLTD